MNNLPGQVKFYIFILSILAIAIISHSFNNIDLNATNLIAIVFFIFISVVSESLTIQLPKGARYSVTFAVDLACIILFGPDIAIWVALGGELFKKDNIKRQTPYYKIVFNSAQLILSVWLAGITYLYLGGTIDSQPISSIIPFIGAMLVYSFVNISTVTIVLALVQKISPWGIWLMNFRWVAPNFLTFAPLGLLMASMYKLTGMWGVSLFFIPLLLARYVFKSYMDVRQIYLDTLEALASTLDAKDKYTRGHSERVAKYAVQIARELKLPEDQVETIEHVALLHDIGKIGVSAELLNRKGQLSASEFDLIKLHPVIGANILKEIHDLGSATEYVRYHHEKYDGSGYPDGLKGDNIPLGARIITLADSFDAMTSDRSYRKKMNWEEALEEVKRSAGTHFDPQIVKAFLNRWENRTIPTQPVQPIENPLNLTQ